MNRAHCIIKWLSEISGAFFERGHADVSPHVTRKHHSIIQKKPEKKESRKYTTGTCLGQSTVADSVPPALSSACCKFLKMVYSDLKRVTV